MRIYVAFSKVDALYFSGQANSFDRLLAPCDVDSKAVVINYSTYNVDFTSACRDIRNSEIRFSEFIEADFHPFSNNFFECTILPVLRILTSLQAVCDSVVEADKLEVFFKRKVICSKGSLKYFLAEHESQGVVFYDREYSIQPIILSWLKKEKINYSFQMNVHFGLGHIKSIIRIAGVWCLRFLSDFKRVKTIESDELLGVSSVVNVRNLSQFEFVSSLLDSTDRPIALLCGRSFKGGVLLNTVRERLRGTKHLIVEYGTQSLFSVISQYACALPTLFSIRACKYNINGLEVDVTTALKEVRIMACELRLYQNAIHNALTSIESVDSIFFSTEQKSPHASIDAVCAREKGWSCAHLMQCDQAAIDLPNPVFGDGFFVDTRARLHKFQSAWSRSKNKLYFVGAIKNIGKSIHSSTKKPSLGPEACFFSEMDDDEVNTAIIIALIEALQLGHIKSLSVKLHPRDNGKWLQKINGIELAKIISHGSKSLDDILQPIDLALSAPSGIIMDLLCREVPFLLSRLSERYAGIDVPYCDDEFKGTFYSIEDLLVLLRCSLDMKKQVVDLKSRILGDVSEVPSFELMSSTLKGIN